MKIATAIRATVFTALLASFTLAFAQDPAPRNRRPTIPKSISETKAPHSRPLISRRTLRMIGIWRGKFAKLSLTTSLSRPTPTTSKSSCRTDKSPFAGPFVPKTRNAVPKPPQPQ